MAAGMSAIHILSSSAEPLLCRQFRDDIGPNVAHTFRLLYGSSMRKVRLAMRWGAADEPARAQTAAFFFHLMPLHAAHQPDARRHLLSHQERQAGVHVRHARQPQRGHGL